MANLRSKFSTGEIIAAWEQAEGSVQDTAKVLSTYGRGEVSRQLARHWLVGLELHEPQTRSKPTPPPVVKILSLDIETSPIEGRVWGLFKQNVGLNQIVKDWNILSFCAKWLHSDEVIYQDLRDAPNVADDSELVAALWQLLDEADIVIAQNGKRFDVPKIQARFLQHGYKPMRPFKVIDTMLMAKQQFGFTSKKLEYMTKTLCTIKKRDHEKFPGMELWNQCLAGNHEAWEEMRLYNIDDVLSMEELYLIMRPWYVGHPNVAIYNDSMVPACPKCASNNIQQDGWTYTQTGKYEAMHCGDCGGWSRGRYTRNDIEVRRAQFSN
jgi:DNA polymerase elongation subunit (family B)